MQRAVYPGSFDPITNGHLDIIERAAVMYDELVVAVVTNYSKKPTFSTEERIAMIKKSTEGLNNIRVTNFDGLLVDFAAAEKANIIVKGLRAVSDFEYEFQMALMNKKLRKDIETIFIMTNYKYSYLSSSMVKEIASLGGCIKDLVPDSILQDIKNKFKD